MYDTSWLVGMLFLRFSNKLFQDLKAQITELLGPIEVQEEEEAPYAGGLPRKSGVLQARFSREGSGGPGSPVPVTYCPCCRCRPAPWAPGPTARWTFRFPAMMIPAANPFAVLVDETRFADFRAALAARKTSPTLFGHRFRRSLSRDGRTIDGSTRDPALSGLSGEFRHQPGRRRMKVTLFDFQRRCLE